MLAPRWLPARSPEDDHDPDAVTQFVATHRFHLQPLGLGNDLRSMCRPFSSIANASFACVGASMSRGASAIALMRSARGVEQEGDRLSRGFHLSKTADRLGRRKNDHLRSQLR